MKILIVEDDYQLAKSMYQALSAQHIVELTLSGEETLEAVANDNFELVILDLSLPDMSGLMICKKLRKMGQQMPILIVTGEHKPTTIVELLDAGADDYLKKPFAVVELKARIRALGRRYKGATPPPQTISLGDLTLHCGSHIAERQGQEIYLRNKEFIILEQLMLNPDIVISRATLLDKAWDDTEKAWTNLIDVHVKYLRDKIDKPFGTHNIQTIHGLGYKFVPNTDNDSLE